MTIEIVEIIRRSDQGMTRPFICRGDDGQVYFVKGRDAGRRSLICELIGGHLGLSLALPVAPFEIVDVPNELLTIAPGDAATQLGAGKAFGSRKLPVIELSTSHLTHVDEVLQRDVLAFDWWIRNADRNLGETGGNPNLFWNVETEALVVLDHNQAFDRGFSPRDFTNLHAFREQSEGLFGDWEVQQRYIERFLAVMTEWQTICDTVPPEWWFVDDEHTVPTDFSLADCRQLLMRCENEGFWNRT
jgi:hypothetical protein